MIFWKEQTFPNRSFTFLNHCNENILRKEIFLVSLCDKWPIFVQFFSQRTTVCYTQYSVIYTHIHIQMVASYYSVTAPALGHTEWSKAAGYRRHIWPSPAAKAGYVSIIKQGFKLANHRAMFAHMYSCLCPFLCVFTPLCQSCETTSPFQGKRKTLWYKKANII